MNSDSFAAKGGRGLPGLCKELHDRCKDFVDRKGARIPNSSVRPLANDSYHANVPKRSQNMCFWVAWGLGEGREGELEVT